MIVKIHCKQAKQTIPIASKPISIYLTHTLSIYYVSFTLGPMLGQKERVCPHRDMSRAVRK